MGFINGWIVKLNREKVLSIVPHLIALAFIALIPAFIFDATDLKVKLWTHRFHYQLFLFITAFYGSYFFIIPRYFFPRKIIKFFLALLIFMIVLLSASGLAYNQLKFLQAPAPENNENRDRESEVKPEKLLGLHPRMLDDIFFLILVFGFSTGISIVQKLNKEDKQKQELEKVNVENELAFLKKQINPHFFFNSLNNIYALINIDGEQAQKTIEALSGLMRYLIYESESKKVALKKELDFYTDYIDLMRRRLTSKVILTVDISQDVPNVEVPPLLFMDFIENAFKHGVSYRGSSFIDVKLQIIDGKVVFHCKNSIPSANEAKSDQPGGAGIKNITKRLKLLYGERAKLTLKHDESVYDVELIIPI